MDEVLYIGTSDRVARAALARFRRDGLAPYHLAPRGARVEGAGAEVDPLDPEAWRSALAEREPRVVLLSPPWHGMGTFVDTSVDDWQEALAQNVEAATYALQATARRMIERDTGGHVLALLHAAVLAPYRGLSVYGTTLAALQALLRMLAVELAPHGIAVNAVAPGFAEGGPLRCSDEALAVVRADTPRGDLVRPEEVAEACALLARIAGVSVTGTVLPVHGGQGLTRGRVGPTPFAAREE